MKRIKVPLLKGKSNFSHNVAAEIAAGKPKNQALAIAYSTLGEKKKGYSKAEVEMARKMHK